LYHTALISKGDLLCSHKAGGMGKTILADQVYREMATMTQFVAAKHMTFDIDAQNLHPFIVGDLQEWIREHSGPVLLYLDNVQTRKQIEELLPDDLLQPGSFLLVTSRTQRLVAGAQEYDMPVMKHSDALALFRWHIQGNAQPPADTAIQVKL
jgi:hypothetical protein